MAGQLLLRLRPQRLQLIWRKFFQRPQRRLLHLTEALAEAQIAVAQSHLGIYSQMSAQVDRGK